MLPHVPGSNGHKIREREKKIWVVPMKSALLEVRAEKTNGDGKWVFRQDEKSTIMLL